MNRDIEQIGDALVRAARNRAASRPIRRRKRRLSAASGFVVASALALGLMSAWRHDSSTHVVVPPRFTQFVFVYEDGRSVGSACAVERCVANVGLGELKVTGVTGISTGSVTSARLVDAKGGATGIPVRPGKRGSVIFGLSDVSNNAGSVELLDARGKVVQTLRA